MQKTASLTQFKSPLLCIAETPSLPFIKFLFGFNPASQPGTQAVLEWPWKWSSLSKAPSEIKP